MTVERWSKRSRVGGWVQALPLRMQIPIPVLREVEGRNNELGAFTRGVHT